MHSTFTLLYKWWWKVTIINNTEWANINFEWMRHSYITFEQRFCDLHVSNLLCLWDVDPLKGELLLWFKIISVGLRSHWLGAKEAIPKQWSKPKIYLGLPGGWSIVVMTYNNNWQLINLFGNCTSCSPQKSQNTANREKHITNTYKQDSLTRYPRFTKIGDIEKMRNINIANMRQTKI